MRMIDPKVIEALVDRLTATELVDALGLSVEEIIDSFEPEVLEKLEEIKDVFDIRVEDTPEGWDWNSNWSENER